jgi:alpha-galactosidase
MAEESQSTTTNRELTFGEKLVGITFNPSSDDKVAKAKALFAEAADLLMEEMSGRETSPLSKTIKEAAVADILRAQMMVVKAITLKY